MKKILLFISFFLGIHILLFSQENTSITFLLEIHNVIPEKGKIHGGIYCSGKSYKNRIHDIPLEYNTTGEIISKNITLPVGAYLISFYQDLDNDGKCKTGLFGIPKEPVGITNWNGSGVPGSFENLKIQIDSTTKKIVIVLYTL
ncbi:MAG TPA: DUF2141 domain-containing protein [Syntrophales bacterium]|nr:DUF2141 domain-containing protein [Syntrophales bacterium]